MPLETFNKREKNILRGIFGIFTHRIPFPRPNQNKYDMFSLFSGVKGLKAYILEINI